ncbi:MAG TPA: response regulator transcription factor [Cyclobacteriaceae bacterium]|jgi:DNA-binding NarL/FixJ family response regulator|nr:response regulator transcription factor [Cyclobacteriaceae bacterium]
MKKLIRVFIVDDHPMVIEGMLSMLQQQPSIEVAGYAMNAASCLGFFIRSTADVVLMDINLPDKSGTDLCKELKQRFPQMKILGISNLNQGSYIREMMNQGASGYVLKNVSKSELLDAVQRVHKGQQYLSLEVSQAMRLETQRQESLPLLTKREKEVLKLIVEGLTNPAIAEKLFVSLSTIESHRKSLLAKFQLKNTAALVRVALENKLV